MKKIRLFCWALVLILGFNLTVCAETEPSESESAPAPIYTDVTGDSSVANGCHSLNAQRSLWGSDRLLETAGAAMLYEVNSQSMLYAWNPDLTVHPASLVKIMTCLLALENGDLSEKLTISSTVIKALPKGVQPNFVVGEVWTMEQLLYCTMVGGYNDAAMSIAEHIAGSQKAFVRMMNQRAKEIGCTGTVFTNATGLHDDEQVTTTRDLVKILNEALKNEKFKPFFSQTIYRLPANDLHESRYMETANYMMTSTITQEYYDVRVTGGRTGVTQARERCLIVTAESKGLYYIAIVMCAKSTYDDEGNVVRFGSYEEVKELIKKGFSNHQVTQILSSEQILTQYPVASGKNSVAVGPSENCFAVLPSDVLSTDLSYRYQQIPTLTAPVEEGEFITSVQVWYGDVCVAQSPVLTKNGSLVATVADQSIYIEKTGDGMRIFMRLLAIAGALVVFAVVVLIMIRLTRQAKLRAQHRRRRVNRRRSR